MNLKSLLALAAFVLPLNAFALGPVNTIERIVIKTEQFKGVSMLLEQGLGRPLTANEKAQLARTIPNGPIDTDEDKLIIKVANGDYDKTFALYCVDASGAAALRGSIAVCASLQTMKFYTLGALGIGYSLQLSLNAFRLEISFDSSRYSPQFDPIPGNYVLGTAGGALIAGGSIFYGTAGNKSLNGAGLSIGLGIDFGTLNGLYIE